MTLLLLLVISNPFIVTKTDLNQNLTSLRKPALEMHECDQFFYILWLHLIQTFHTLSCTKLPNRLDVNKFLSGVTQCTHNSLSVTWKKCVTPKQTAIHALDGSWATVEHSVSGSSLEYIIKCSKDAKRRNRDIWKTIISLQLSLS